MPLRPNPLLPGLLALVVGAVSALGVEHPRLSDEKIADLKARFGAVKTWQIEYRYSGDNPHQWSEGGEDFIRTRWTETSQGSFLLPTSEKDALRIRIHGSAPSFDSIDHYRVQQANPGVYRETRYDRGSGPAKVGVDITLDLETGTYDLSFINNEFTANYGGTKTNAFETRRYDATATTHVVMPIPAPADVTLRLPEDGVVISGGWSHEEEMQARRRHDDSFDESRHARSQPTRGRLSWTISPADYEPLDVELIVEPQGYDAWMPQGGADEASAGNQIALKATLVSKSGGPLEHRATQMTYSLSVVSKEPGVALNFPLSGATAREDLAFEASRNSEGEVSTDGQSVRFSRGPYETTTATLSSFDWGAYGAVVVVARLDNGRTVQGRLQDGTTPDVLVPKRSGGGSIADAWRQSMEFPGSDGEDDDLQKENPRNGDGLTAYEEYRGMLLKGKHTRATRLLDPTRKNLIVVNEIGSAAAEGLALMESASGIHVIEAARGDFPPSRQVNPNRGTASGGEQYGLRLVEEKLEGSTAGENRPAAELNKTPRKSQQVVIDLALAGQYYNEQASVVKAAGETMPYSLSQDIANTIAHELAHGVGAPHHGKASEYFSKREVTVRMTDWKAYGIDGGRLVPTESNPIQLVGNIGRPGNEASGDVGCIMAYANYYQWAAVGREGGPYTFYAIPPQPLGDHFCTNSSPTGYNARHTLRNGTYSPGFFGPARGQTQNSTPGNCLGAMCVRDW